MAVGPVPFPGAGSRAEITAALQTLFESLPDLIEAVRLDDVREAAELAQLINRLTYELVTELASLAVQAGVTLSFMKSMSVLSERADARWN